MYRWLTLLAGCICLSCAPSVHMKLASHKEPWPRELPVLAYRGPAVPEGTAWLGTLALTDNGLSVNCSQKDMLRLGGERVRRVGGNALHIREVAPPDMLSTCYRIWGDVLRLPDSLISFRERRIVWSAGRQLAWDDFGAPIDTLHALGPGGRPKIVHVHCELEIEWTVSTSRYFHATVTTVFNRLRSALPSQAVPQAIPLGRLYFDMAEVQARWLRAQIVALKARLPLPEFVQARNRPFHEHPNVMPTKFGSDWPARVAVDEALKDLKQTTLQRLEAQIRAAEADITVNPTRLPAWQARTAQQLDSLRAYSVPFEPPLLTEGL